MNSKTNGSNKNLSYTPEKINVNLKNIPKNNINTTSKNNEKQATDKDLNEANDNIEDDKQYHKYSVKEADKSKENNLSKENIETNKNNVSGENRINTFKNIETNKHSATNENKNFE